MLDSIIVVICALLISFIIFGGMIVKKSEKKRWNNGICKECGLKWIHFDTDSQGGRMYRCDNWHYCNVSYNVDKIK